MSQLSISGQKKFYIKLVIYRWYHENGSFSVNSFNEHYLSISQYTTQVAEGTVFRKHVV